MGYDRLHNNNTRLHNKGVYLQLGVQKTFSRDTSGELHTQITLKVYHTLSHLKCPY